MKKRIIILGLTLLILNACISKSDYEKLKKEKSELEILLEETKQELSDVSYKYDQIIEENRQAEFERIRKKRQAEIERNKVPYISDTKAKQYIKDNYAFYEKDTKYRNLQLRRVADNSFKVSLEECYAKVSVCNEDFFWRSRVRTLTVHNNGKYDF